MHVLCLWSDRFCRLTWQRVNICVRRVYYYYYYFCFPVVFMGSKRYKKENAFDDFIAKHGGDNNAWTDTERVTRSRNLCCVQNNCAVLCIYMLSVWIFSVVCGVHAFLSCVHGGYREGTRNRNLWHVQYKYGVLRIYIGVVSRDLFFGLWWIVLVHVCVCVRAYVHLNPCVRGKNV